ncbi:DUF2505 domain-containing protein [Knoellia subterranea]|uniref:DUF2505 domain-containing protein n=1 Tax=Knoellia subterranea KCTC 19937 TaxID=1385521 RepID=A0A0A0JI22_9MICO|nr:DUF2505 domain-containing protein [Knoellia subterranea]KGN37000.1 hypothetical protein N803_16420 [Knoellia subterranea KCTC 19937]
MKFTHRAEYAASPDEVWATMSSQEFQDAKCEATTTGEWTSNVSTTGDRTTITSDRVLPTDDLPDIAKSFVGSKLTIAEVQTWGPAAADGSRTADLNVHIKGAPMTLKGTARLSPNGSGTVQEIQGDVKVSVPLIGGKLEKAASEPLMFAAKTETDLLRDRLS